jgi:hypothetical protein
MPCIPLPTVPKPQLPAPLSIGLPTLQTPPLQANLCCQFSLPQIILPLPPIPLGFLGPALAPILAAIDAAEAQVDAWLAAIPVNCPLE